MTNREKYAEQILDMAVNTISIAVDKEGKPCDCNAIRCSDCTFIGGRCRKGLKEWSEQEYVEPPVDWSKVSVDTKILVRDSENETWRKRHFAKFENGKIYTWNDGRSSFTAFELGSTSWWNQGKLAEDTV